MLALAPIDPPHWPVGVASALLADAVATLVVFGFSFAFRNSSFYDPYWSVAPPLLGFYYWGIAGYPADPRVGLVLSLTLLWAVRLTFNWAHGWRGLDHEDWRYRALERRLARWYWPVSLLGIHGFPTLVVFVGCLPLYLVAAGRGAPLGMLDGLAAAIGIGALALETRADLDLERHRRTRRSSAEVLERGVWARCRHPNYLGEIGFWLSLGVFGLAAGGGLLWSLAGTATMLALFLGISIPLIEGKLVADKPGYAAYRARTPVLLPRIF